MEGKGIVPERYDPEIVRRMCVPSVRSETPLDTPTSLRYSSTARSTLWTDGPETPAARALEAVELEHRSSISSISSQGDDPTPGETPTSRRHTHRPSLFTRKKDEDKTVSSHPSTRPTPSGAQYY